MEDVWAKYHKHEQRKKKIAEQTTNKEISTYEQERYVS